MTEQNKKFIQSITTTLNERTGNWFSENVIIKDMGDNKVQLISPQGIKIILRQKDSHEKRNEKIEFLYNESLLLENEEHEIVKAPSKESVLIKTDPPSFTGDQSKEDILIKTDAPSFTEDQFKEDILIKTDAPSGSTQHIQRGDIEFDILISVKDGKKYFTCPCGNQYDQKGHAVWNHINRHLNKKVESGGRVGMHTDRCGAARSKICKCPCKGDRHGELVWKMDEGKLNKYETDKIDQEGEDE